MENCAAVVLAAGLGSRMGTDNKLLRPLHQRPVLEWGLKTLSNLSLGHVVVVTGRDAAKVAALAEKWGYHAHHNEDFQRGMGTSLATGFSHLPTNIQNAFVVLGDMPAISAQTYRQLHCALQNTTQHSVARPMYELTLGHPVLFSACFFPQLCTLGGDQGAQSLLKQYAGQVLRVPVDDPYCFCDTDTPEALLELQQKWRPSDR